MSRLVPLLVLLCSVSALRRRRGPEEVATVEGRDGVPPFPTARACFSTRVIAPDVTINMTVLGRLAPRGLR